MTTNEICSYLKDVLNFRDFIELPDNSNDYFCISNKELQSGEIEKSGDRMKLMQKWNSSKNHRQVKNNKFGHRSLTDNEEGGDEDIDLLIIPRLVCDMVPVYGNTINCNKDRSWEYRKVSLFYIKVKCNLKTFKLKNIHTESLIWADPLINRVDSNPIIRLVKKIASKLLKNKFEDIRKFEFQDALGIPARDYEWHEYMSLIEKSFLKRTGKLLFGVDSLNDEDGISHLLYDEDIYGKCIVMKDDTVFATQSICNLLSDIVMERGNLKLSLLTTMLTGSRKQKIRLAYQTGSHMDNHIGQMKNEYPLADAQRAAVHAFSSLEEGEVLAVSGPPGTGKTTMLQSIVAQMVVDFAFNKKPAPLILATSANNKAITNIIDAFSMSNNNTTANVMHERWITYETNNEHRERYVPMAVYLPSGSAVQNNNADYFISDMQGGGDYETLRRKYYQDCSNFIRKANIALNGHSNDGKELYEVEEIKKRLLQELKRCHEKLKFIAIGAEESTEAVNIDQALDKKERYELYWLSVHYNECLWIEKILEYRNQGELKYVYSKFFLDEIKLVCPCVIATFFRAPKLFEFKSKEGRVRYNYGLADLLIVDEAGQVSPEIGLPTFALAKKAVVVGDIKQIPPVYSIPTTSDSVYWQKNVKSRYNDEERELMSCVSSSIMAIAEHQCMYQRKAISGKIKNGLFLNEHRRCVDDIIDYSNKLLYDNELLPKRGPSAEKAVCKGLPPMGIFIHESDSDTKGGSRCNKSEVDAICTWIEANKSNIIEAYDPEHKGKKLEKLICIITPFKAQSMLLKSDVRLKNIPIGTVHTFQGAESPIVIFSMVYGKRDNPVFIKRNHELMNVAVSRAKDHFIVVGSRQCLGNNRSDLACGLLYDALKVL